MRKNKVPKIGLALGAGGPRGFAHIGVIKILEKNNIPIDFIAGSSIGAMAGGLYASSKDIAQIEKDILKTDLKQIVSLVRPSLHQGLIDNERILKFIEKRIGGIGFKDLQIPLSVVATDINTGEGIYINKGKVVPAIMASISLPLIFRPLKLGGRLLADGGLSVPVPVEEVRKMGADIVIAVNLDASYFTEENNSKTYLGFYRIADNSINIMRYHLASSDIRTADLVISPKLGTVRWREFLDPKEVIVAGEKAMNRELKELQSLISSRG